MKKINVFILILLMGALSFSSCKSFFEDSNTDPDNPVSVSPGAILPLIQVRVAYVLGGDASRKFGLLSQYLDPIRHFYGDKEFSYTEAMWGQNFYFGALIDGRQLMIQSEEKGYNHYLGIGKAMEAFIMMCITDWWGDAPYSEALKGMEYLQPKFDSQKEIYLEIFKLLDEARMYMAMEGGGLSPGTDDLYYGGDMLKWIKFCNVLEARAHLHLGKVDDQNYQNTLDALAKGSFTSTEDEARLQFGAEATNNAPWAQFINQSLNFNIGDNYVELMNSLDDPRINYYGLELDLWLDHPILTGDRLFPILTYTEVKFIEAECYFKIGNQAAAYQSYLVGIESSFREIDVLKGNYDQVVLMDSFDDYLANPEVDPGESNLTLNEIMTQKHIAMFLDPEVFTDWRRTGIPALVPNFGNEIPRRLAYPDSEFIQNENTPSAVTTTIYSRVWWDQ